MKVKCVTANLLPSVATSRQASRQRVRGAISVFTADRLALSVAYAETRNEVWPSPALLVSVNGCPANWPPQPSGPLVVVAAHSDKYTFSPARCPLTQHAVNPVTRTVTS
jgi:hypothetical protein